jgi:Skp family chaperone for outer membrane proteins
MTRPTLAAFALGATVALASFLAGNADATRALIVPAQPTAIGVIDLAKLFDGLGECAEWDVRIKALEARVMDEARARKASLESGLKEVEAMTEGVEKENRLDALRLQKLQAEQWSLGCEMEADRERSLKWQSVYRSVREGAKKLGETEGYQLVVIDDSKIEIQTQRAQNSPPLETQAKGQIAQLRVLYADRTIDVTDKLIVQLNNKRSSSVTPASSSATTATKPTK